MSITNPAEYWEEMAYLRKGQVEALQTRNMALYSINTARIEELEHDGIGEPRRDITAEKRQLSGALVLLTEAVNKILEQ